MKIALLGNGKTGSKVRELADGHSVIVFDSKNTPTLDDLKECDIAICFLAGPVFEEYVNLLIGSSIPAVIGSTGSSWQEGLNDRLKAADLAWVYAPNFSRNMDKLKNMIETLASIQDRGQPSLIEETHHIDKVDSPSGTALAWQEWFGEDVDFIDYREADTYGVHRLTVKTNNEVISVEHTVTDRAAFAQGALDAAEKLHAGAFKSGLTNLLD